MQGHGIPLQETINDPVHDVGEGGGGGRVCAFLGEAAFE